MSVSLRVQGGQKWEWPQRRNPVRFVLNVIDDEAIDRQRPKPHQLLGYDCFQLVRWRRLLWRSKAIKANPRLPRGQFIGKGSFHRVSERWVARPQGTPKGVRTHGDIVSC